jgi:hypothetical protein
MADRIEVIAALGLIQIVFPEFTTTDHTIDLYARLLEDIDGAVLAQAVDQCLADPDRKFFPKPGELRGIAAKITAPPKMSGIEAWGELQRELRRCGRYAYLHPSAPKPKFSNPILLQLVEAIGWDRCCDMPMDNDYIQPQFIKNFEELAKQEAENSKLLPSVREFKQLYRSENVMQLVNTIQVEINKNAEDFEANN